MVAEATRPGGLPQQSLPGAKVVVDETGVTGDAARYSPDLEAHGTNVHELGARRGEDTFSAYLLTGAPGTPFQCLGAHGWVSSSRSMSVSDTQVKSTSVPCM